MAKQTLLGLEVRSSDSREVSSDQWYSVVLHALAEAQKKFSFSQKSAEKALVSSCKLKLCLMILT
jgi:hypothetical protein